MNTLQLQTHFYSLTEIPVFKWVVPLSSLEWQL